MAETRVLVCGGRDYQDSEVLFNTLSMYHEEYNFAVLMQGGAKGADSEAKRWAQYHPEIKVLTFPANWKRNGKAAGPIRNQQMLTEGKPDLVIAFPGGRGTANMVSLARNIGVKVIEL